MRIHGFVLLVSEDFSLFKFEKINLSTRLMWIGESESNCFKPWKLEDEFSRVSENEADGI